MTLFHTLADWQRQNEPYTAIGAAAIVCITWYIDVRTDFARWEKGAVNHIRGAWLRLLGFIPATLLDWHSGLLWALYWPLFDGVLGVWVKKREIDKFNTIPNHFSWWYLGTSSWLDRMQHRFKWLVWVKYGLAVTALILYLTFKF